MNNSTNKVFTSLFEILETRKSADPQKSYAASLFAKGSEGINKKITEEAQEVCEAALENNKDHLIYEICDLLFHTFVLASHNNITLDEIQNELLRRHGTSGLTEKENRKNK